VTCEAFLNRLYDDDARAAQRGQGSIPPDMARHMVACGACRAAYDSAGADERLLVRAFVESPPLAWRAEVLRQVQSSPQFDWTRRIATVNQVVTWGTLALAASHILWPENSTAAFVAAFSAGGAAALLLPSLGKPSIVLLHRTLRLV
jgi:hypothetical protein